jgi:ATP-dependent DNA helicase RecG
LDTWSEENIYMEQTMTREALQELLNRHEWKDVEFKASQRGVSNSAYETQKPIYLNGDIRHSYIRRGAGDEKCKDFEIERFLRDSGGVPHDSQLIEDVPVDACFDEEVVQWYRGAFGRRNPGRHEALSNLAFLNEWGFTGEKDGKLLPTRAGILVFGTGKYVRQVLIRPVVDYQRIDYPAREWTPELRWSDRLTIEENLVRAWWGLAERYSKLAERPFNLDAATMRRDDEPPDYISFREATINLLMHQDYGDHTRMAQIHFFRDQTLFFNPGDAFYTESQLLDPGAKDVRNPSIVNAFRRIGLSDQAGTGFRAICKNWNQLGNVPPDLQNDKTEKTFRLLLSWEPLITERQKIFQSTLGVHLTPFEAEAFAYACRKGEITVTDVRAGSGVSASIRNPDRPYPHPQKAGDYRMRWTRSRCQVAKKG